jgi:hypothetical protein
MITTELNYIPLSKAMPEYSKREGKPYVCTLGYDMRLGFIRVYPTPLSGIKPWQPIRFKAEKNKRDPRPASWKMPEDCRHGEWSVKAEKVTYGESLNKASQMTILREMMAKTVISISQLNASRESIGFLLVDSYKIVGAPNKNYIDSRQYGMFDDVELAGYTLFTKDLRETTYRVHFRDGDGIHDLQLNRWDIYETARNCTAREAIARFQRPGPHILMLGNLLQHQNVWSVLGIWGVPTQLPLF